jgi:hypothetical protein
MSQVSIPAIIETMQRQGQEQLSIIIDQCQYQNFYNQTLLKAIKDEVGRR